jgi:cell division protein FtsQ
MPTLRRPTAAQAARAAQAAAAAAGPTLPMDVRLMNATAGLLVLLAALGAGLAAWSWLMQTTRFPIRAIELQGELARSSLPTIRANAGPRLAGNFFSVDLQASRGAFESVPWVRHAVVSRVWPDRLRVRLEEHRAVALWAGEDVSEPERLVNDRGEIFDANLGEVEDEALPVLAGPEGSAAAMLGLLSKLTPRLAALDLDVATLTLNGRGAWRAVCTDGSVIELGRGSEDELMARVERLVRTYAAATTRWRGPLELADLRYDGGYALKLKGVTTGAAASAPRSN